MTRTRKVLAALLVAILALCMIVGCAKKEEPAAAAPAAAEEKGPVELHVLNYLDFSSPNSMNEVTEIWDRFSAEHPDIKVIREDLFNDAFHNKTEAYVAGGNLPDVVYMWPGGRSTSLQTTGAVRDIMPLLEKDGLVDSYSPAALAPQAGGFLAMLPSGSTSSHMMFANTKVLRENGLELPETMQDLIDMVPVLKAKGIDVVGMDNMDDWVMQSCLFSLIVGRFGGADWYNELADGKIDFNGDWFVNALKTVETLYETGVINRNSLNSGYGSMRGPFAQGQCAFLIDGDWACGAFQMDQSTGQALLSRDQQVNDLELIVFPEIPGEKVHNTTSGVVATGFGISSELKEGSRELDAAWELVKFLQGQYVQEYRLKTGAGFPSNTKVDVDKVIKENDLEPIVGKRASFYGNYGVTPVVDSVLNPEVFSVINAGLQEIGLGTKTAEQVAAETNEAWLNWKANN